MKLIYKSGPVLKGWLIVDSGGNTLGLFPTEKDALEVIRFFLLGGYHG